MLKPMQQRKQPKPMRASGPPKAKLQKLLQLQEQGRTEQAQARLGPLLQRFPNSIALLNIAGALHAQRREFAQAKQCFSQALLHAPQEAGTLCNLAYLHYEFGDFTKACELYCRVLKVAPEHRVAQTNLGNCLLRMDLLDQAIACFDLVLRLHPDDSTAHMLRARALVLRGDLIAGREAYRQAARTAPQNGTALAHVDDLTRQMCDWAALPDVTADQIKACSDTPPPWHTLAICDDPAWQLDLSTAHAKRKDLTRRTPAQLRQTQGAVRVGVFSADFHEHATMDLLKGLIREHDRARLELILFSYGTTAAPQMHHWLRSHVSAFHDVSKTGDADIAALARTMDLDVAIDLKGYTANSRSEIFANRLAPAHINFLGYPGTLGRGAHDYIIADPIIIPDELAHHYGEAILHMPHCYQPNDNQRAIIETTTTRADMGLSDDAFVLCCFNNPYKISPAEFDIWMRVMRDTPNTQLWLLPRNNIAQDNLRRHAHDRGIDPDRLVFADMCPSAEHLARHRHADLFVDCFNVNAHTTASDALWAGLPVVSKVGRQFAARVSASLLTAAGLPDLIANSDAEYESIIQHMVLDPAAHADAKARLASAHQNAPLFDTKTYADDFATLMEGISRPATGPSLRPRQGTRGG